MIKTQKQVIYSKKLISPVLVLFFKEKILTNLTNGSFNTKKLNSWIYNFSERYFTKKLFLLFKNLVYFRFGLITNQLTLSYNFHLINILYKNIIKFKNKNLLNIPHKKGLNARMLNIITTTSFSFHNKTYNTLIFYIFNLLFLPYVSMLNEYELKYSYIVLPNFFELYLFINYFYFRVNNF